MSAKREYLVAIRNDCVQDGERWCMFTIDRAKKGENFQEIEAYCIKRQKHIIAGWHSGHDYKLTVFRGDAAWAEKKRLDEAYEKESVK